MTSWTDRTLTANGIGLRSNVVFSPDGRLLAIPSGTGILASKLPLLFSGKPGQEPRPGPGGAGQ